MILKLGKSGGSSGREGCVVERWVSGVDDTHSEVRGGMGGVRGD